MKLTIKDGRDHFYTFDTNRILLLTATDEDMIKQVEFSTEENGEEVSWTSEVLTGSDGVKYVQVPNEFLNGDYTRLVCYYVALDSNGEYTRQKEIFRIRARQEPQDYFLTYSERVTFASIKALTEQYKATTKQYMDTTEGFKDNAGRSAELASKYAENNEDVAVEPGKYSAKHWSIKAEAAKKTAVQKATEAGTSEVNSKTYMESAQSAKQDAETAKNDANTILEQVQSKGTEITNFVVTSKTEIETQKNESVNAVKSVYQTDLNELKGDLDNINIQMTPLDGVAVINQDDFEIGNITINGSGWTYSSVKTRVRTKEGITYSLQTGDIIGLSDYTDARFYLGWLRKNGTYGYNGWITSDYTISEDGDYVIVIANLTDRNQNNDKSALLNLLKIKFISNTKDKADDLVNRLYSNLYLPLENIRLDITTSGWEWKENDWRVSLKENTSLSLLKGDIVSLKNYEKYSFFIGWRTAEGIYKTGSNWKLADYKVTEDGEYVITVRQGLSEKPDDLNDMMAQLTVYHQFNANDIGGYNKTLEIAENVTNSILLETPYVKGINHRGFNNIAPENTLPAYKLSKQMGFTYVETDVSFTSDDVPVLLHDGTINRTARNKDGTEIESTINIYDITYEQALGYDFGIWKDEKYVGTKIPTLEQFIVLCRNLGLYPYIELKTDGGYTDSQIQECVNIVKKCGMIRNVTWISFSKTYLDYVKNYDLSARLGFLCNEINATNIGYVQDLQNNTNEVFINVANAYVTDDGITLAMNADIPVEVWTVNDISTIQSINPYITGITSDKVIASKVLAKYGIN